MFLTSALDGGEWSASHDGSLTPGETVAVGPRAGLDVVAKSCPCRPVFQN